MQNNINNKNQARPIVSVSNLTISAAIFENLFANMNVTSDSTFFIFSR